METFNLVGQTVLVVLGGLGITAGVLLIPFAAIMAWYQERKHRKRNPDPVLPVRTKDGTFTLTWSGETTYPVAYDATAADISVAIASLTRPRELADLSGAENEEEFYSDQVYWYSPGAERPWVVYRVDSLGNYTYQECFVEPRYTLDPIWDLSFVIWDDEDHLVRSEN